MTWPDLGVPSDARARELLFSVPAGLMVLHAKVEHRLGLSRLYGKALAAERYDDLVPSAADETIDHPAVCAVTPSLYYMAQVKEVMHGRHPVMRDGREEWVDDEQETIGGWIKGVFRKDLITGVIRPLVEYRLREEQDEWVSRLHGVFPDGKALLCSAAHLDPGSTLPGRTYSYSLCRLDVDSGALTKLAPLRAVFF
jgi:hypothetical protein